MIHPVPMVEVWRADLLESAHVGHAVVCDAGGQVIAAWGNPDAVIFPRSSCKMIQALPLVESGAAAAAGLGTRQLALACASHQGAALHVREVTAWLDTLGLSDADLRCGAETSRDAELRDQMIRDKETPCQIHNNCSGKHSGFLTLARHLRADPEYVDPAHPVQRAARAAHEDVTAMTAPTFGIDGCSAPNFATTVTGLARAMAAFAVARDGQGTRPSAMAALRDAMVAHPDLVAGEGRACTHLMRAMDGVAIKTGAEGVFVAMLPEQGLGVALKIIDGAFRASNCAIAALLCAMGVLDRADPAARLYLDVPLTNLAGHDVGMIRAAPGFADKPIRAAS